MHMFLEKQRKEKGGEEKEGETHIIVPPNPQPIDIRVRIARPHKTPDITHDQLTRPQIGRVSQGNLLAIHEAALTAV
jgi:hypothetical protein